MRIVAISDTHTHHMDVVVPNGDVLVHAGDFTYKGRREEIVELRSRSVQSLVNSLYSFSMLANLAGSEIFPILISRIENLSRSSPFEISTFIIKLVAEA